MTDGTWDDYVDLSGVDATDPSTAVPAIDEAVNDFADSTDLAGGVSDLDQVSLDTAGYQTGLASDQQSWADWNDATADQAATDAAGYVDDGNAALASGDYAAAEDAFDSAQTSSDYAATNYDEAASNETAVDGYLDEAGSSLGSVDYSADTSSDY